MASRTLDPDVLVRDNQKLVYREVNNYLRQHSLVAGCDRDDLISFGLIGLLKAARGYQSSRGEFSSYAVPAIRREIINGAEMASRPFRRYKLLSLDEPSQFIDSDDGERAIDQLVAPVDVELTVLGKLEFQAALQRLYQLGSVMAEWVVFARGYYGQTFTEMGQGEGVTSAAISLRYYRALKKIQKMG